MNKSAFDFQILQLTEKFYKAYPNPPYKEILQKQKRAYNCLLIQSHYQYFICIPFRSEIHHPYAYMFRHSQRSKKHKSGLDYTKMVIISNPDYITATTTIVDQDEYNETRQNINRIVHNATEFMDEYVEHVTNKKLLHEREFQRRYQFSPLKYFHSQLII